MNNVLLDRAGQLSVCEIRHKKSTMKGNLHRAKVLESFCESFALFCEFVKVLRKFWKVFRVFEP
jgi:hypothetical protein